MAEKDGAEATRVVPARVTLFGFDPRSVPLTLRPRPRRWRVVGALRIGGIALLVAPAVALVPPHAPWALGALGVGGLLARRRLQERFTVEGVDGSCPRCGGSLTAAGGRLRSPHPAACDACNNEMMLRVDPADLDAAAAA